MPPFAAPAASMPPPPGGLPMALDPAYALPGGVDLQSAAADAMLAALGIALSRAPGPNPDNWPKVGGKPTKPSPKQVVDQVTTDREWHADWLTILALCDDFLEGRTHGRFNRHKEDLISGELEHFWDPTLRNEHAKGVEELSSYEWAWESPTREFVDSEESRAKGDGLAYHAECWARQHDRDGGGDLRAALVDDAMRKGVLVSAHAIDLDTETGIRSMIYDPATCYPSIERGRGLSRVTCIYQSRADELIAKYGNNPKLARKLKKLASVNGDYDPSFEVEVCEWWDRNWGVIVIDDMEAWSIEHGRQEVPFVVTKGNYGKQSHTTMTRSDSPMGYASPRDTFGRYGMSTTNVSRRDERASESQPYVWRRLKSHVLKEAVGVVLATAVRDWRKQPMVVSRSLQERKLNGRVDIDYGEEGQTDVGESAKVLPLRDPGQLAMLVNPMAALLGAGDATSGVPAVAFGANPAAQTSGTAAKQLSAEGKDVYRPVARHVERHLSECGEMWLRLWRDYGDALGSLEHPGIISVPRRSGRGGAHKIDRKLIERTGTRATCTLIDPDILGDVGRINAAMMAMNTGLLTKWTVRKQIGADPDVEQEREDRQNLAEVPQVGQKNTLRLLLADIKEAMERGDEESLQVAIDDAKLVAMLMGLDFQRQFGMQTAMEKMGMGGPGGESSGGPSEPPVGPDGEPMAPGQLPPGPMGGGPDAMSGANFQGASLPEFGIDTGVMGGRPPGMMPGEV